MLSRILCYNYCSGVEALIFVLANEILLCCCVEIVILPFCNIKVCSNGSSILRCFDCILSYSGVKKMLTAVITSVCTHSNPTNKSANQLVAQCSLAANQTRGQADYARPGSSPQLDPC